MLLMLMSFKSYIETCKKNLYLKGVPVCELIDTVCFGALESNCVEHTRSVTVIISNGTVFDVPSILFTINLRFVNGHSAKCVPWC